MIWTNKQFIRNWCGVNFIFIIKITLYLTRRRAPWRFLFKLFIKVIKGFVVCIDILFLEFLQLLYHISLHLSSMLWSLKMVILKEPGQQHLRIEVWITVTLISLAQFWKILIWHNGRLGFSVFFSAWAWHIY